MAHFATLAILETFSLDYIMDTVLPFGEEVLPYKELHKVKDFETGGTFSAKFGKPVIRVKDLTEEHRLSFFAVVERGHWHERAYMGSEGPLPLCEMTRVVRVLPDDEHLLEPVLVTTYMEDSETWRKKFRERFINGLDPDTLLVVLDCHV